MNLGFHLAAASLVVSDLMVSCLVAFGLVVSCLVVLSLVAFGGVGQVGRVI